MGVGDIGDSKARRCALRRLRDLDQLEALRNDQPLRGGDPGGNSGNMEKAAPGERAHPRKVLEKRGALLVILGLYALVRHDFAPLAKMSHVKHFCRLSFRLTA